MMVMMMIISTYIKQKDARMKNPLEDYHLDQAFNNV